MGFFDKIKAGLAKTRDALSDSLGSVFSGNSELDEDFYDELEESLILADLGVDTAAKAVERLRKTVRERHLKETEEAKAALKEILVDMLNVGDTALDLSTTPSVVLVIGVNGVGKTTTIGKLALRFQGLGRTIILCAADTFRAAAADQLQVWSERARCPIVRHKEGADPAGVVFDGVQAAKAQKADLLIVDTAGRLHNKKNLMDEMEKIRRVIDREYPEATVRCLLVVDATTGQNGLQQARAFREAAGINGIVLTKLDGTAKGGIAFGIVRELKTPVMYVGVGEGIEDLQAFDAKEFVDALFD